MARSCQPSSLSDGRCAAASGAARRHHDPGSHGRTDRTRHSETSRDEKKTQSRARNRDDPDVPFGLEIMDAPEPLLYPKPHKSVNTWRFHVAHRAVRFAAPCGRAPPSWLQHGPWHRRRARPRRNRRSGSGRGFLAIADNSVSTRNQNQIGRNSWKVRFGATSESNTRDACAPNYSRVLRPWRRSRARPRRHTGSRSGRGSGRRRRSCLKQLP